jgi:hypothetical protein
MKPLDDESRRLIDEAHAADAPPPGSEAAVWNALSQKLQQPLPPTAAAASATVNGPATGFFAGATSKLIFGAAALALVAVALTVHLRAQPKVEPAARIVVPSQDKLGARGSSAQEQRSELPAREATGVARTPSIPPSADASSTLLEEAKLLAAAQRALNAGNARRALRWLAEHRERFAGGALAQEREAAQVFALCALGRAVDAQRHAQRFVDHWPDSPLGARVRAGCPKPP